MRKIEIFCRYIIKNGKRIYPHRSKFFHFFIDEDSKIKNKESKSWYTASCFQEILTITSS
jgi:Zn/Cd-binding protein ZinT